MRKFMFQITIGDKYFNCGKIWNYYKRLSMDSNKLENNGFFLNEISGFLMKIVLIKYDTDNCLFDKYKNNKLCLLLTLYVMTYF